MDLSSVKNYLRIDFGEDDVDIQLMIEAAKEYIVDAIGYYDDTSARQKILLLALVSFLYENHQYTVDSANEKIAHVLQSMVLQLQLKAGDPIAE